jgi:hypothetical protein
VRAPRLRLARVSIVRSRSRSTNKASSTCVPSACGSATSNRTTRAHLVGANLDRYRVTARFVHYRPA